jgi:hypothetical protein
MSLSQRISRLERARPQRRENNHVYLSDVGVDGLPRHSFLKTESSESDPGDREAFRAHCMRRFEHRRCWLTHGLSDAELILFLNTEAPALSEQPGPEVTPQLGEPVAEPHYVLPLQALPNGFRELTSTEEPLYDDD